MLKQFVASVCVYSGFALVTAAAWMLSPTLGVAVAGFHAVFIGMCIYRSEEE